MPWDVTTSQSSQWWEQWEQKKGYYDVKNADLCYFADSACEMYNEIFEAITKMKSIKGS